MSEYTVYRSDGASWRGYTYTNWRTFPPSLTGWPTREWIGNDKYVMAQLRQLGWSEDTQEVSRSGSDLHPVVSRPSVGSLAFQAVAKFLSYLRGSH